jgi:hypothetical protein
VTVVNDFVLGVLVTAGTMSVVAAIDERVVFRHVELDERRPMRARALAVLRHWLWPLVCHCTTMAAVAGSASALASACGASAAMRVRACQIGLLVVPLGVLCRAICNLVVAAAVAGRTALCFGEGCALTHSMPAAHDRLRDERWRVGVRLQNHVEIQSE